MRARRFDHISRVDQLISVDDHVFVLAPGLFDSGHAVHVFSFISGQKINFLIFKKILPCFQSINYSENAT